MKAQILATTGIIIGIGGAWAVVENFAPWAKESEVILMAADLYREQSRLKYDQVISTEEALERARKAGDENRVRELKRRLKELSIEQRRYERSHEDYLKRQKGN